MSCNENACTKSDLVSAINSFANAKATNDPNLIQFAGQLVSNLIETLEFKAETTESEGDNQPE